MSAAVSYLIYTSAAINYLVCMSAAINYLVCMSADDEHGRLGSVHLY